MVAILACIGYVAAVWVAAILFSYVLSSVGVPKADFVARALAYFLSMIVSSIFGVVASVFLRLVGYGQLSQWAVARSFKYNMLVTAGVTFDVEDPNGYLDKIRPAVFIGPHQTELDVLMLGCIFPKYCSQTAKASLKWIPFLGWFMALSGTIFLNRSNSKDSREKMRGAADEIRNRRQSVYMFPEGTRSYAKEPTLLPFKKGAFHLAVQAQVPIVPVVVANYSHIYYPKGFVFKSGSIPCKVLDPISTEGLTAADVDQLTIKTHELMLKEMIALTERARGKPLADGTNGATNGVGMATGAEARVSA
ncbi:1-acylglycerol-3-phosphate O-acyltransferase [Madurella fahalii]|uniref:1-acyl-sn-glycerol-3-phosphate acyltransferase n=1 Tax=Madurella fahalii TaxID=1157608 RepID=A0ABQ0GSP3_9PEZI